MIDRMIVSANVFRISKPGYDVNVASGRNLAFSESFNGLIPSAKGFFGGSKDIALPDVGFVPIIYVQVDQQVVGAQAVINPEKTVLSIYNQNGNAMSGRYIIFRNRQF